MYNVTDKVFGLLMTYVEKAEGALRIKALASLGMDVLLAFDSACHGLFLLLVGVYQL